MNESDDTFAATCLLLPCHRKAKPQEKRRLVHHHIETQPTVAKCLTRQYALSLKDLPNVHRPSRLQPSPRTRLDLLALETWVGIWPIIC